MACGEHEGITLERFNLGSKLKRVVNITIPPTIPATKQIFGSETAWTQSLRSLDEEEGPRN
jgi:hypothetical protein